MCRRRIYGGTTSLLGKKRILPFYRNICHRDVILNAALLAPLAPYTTLGLICYLHQSLNFLLDCRSIPNSPYTALWTLFQGSDYLHHFIQLFDTLELAPPLRESLLQLSPLQFLPGAPFPSSLNLMHLIPTFTIVFHIPSPAIVPDAHI